MPPHFLSLRLQARCKSSVSAMDWRLVVVDYQRKANDTTASLVAKDVESAVRVCLQNNRTREAVDVVHRAEKRGIVAPLRSYIDICCSWARKGQAERGLAMMPQLCDQYSATCQSTVYDPLLAVFKSQGNWRSTHAAIAQMHKLGILPSLRAFRVLLLTAAKARQTELLMATVEFVETKVPGAWTDVATLTAMCQALVDVGEYQRVVDLYRKLDDDWVHETASTMLMNQVLVAAIRSRDDKPGPNALFHSTFFFPSELATQIFESMQRAQRAPADDFTFATCMLELEKRGEWARVLDLFKMMLDTERRNRNARSNKPFVSVINALSCSAVIRALHTVYQVNGSNTKQNSNDQKALRNLLRNSKDQKRKWKQDLSIVLKLLQTVSLRNTNHASTLIDTLDEFRLLTPARRAFKRLMEEGIIDQTPWRHKDGYEIDLHTFSRGVAKCAVVFAFDEIKLALQGNSSVSCAGNTPRQDLRIITGIGRHSHTFMKPVLRQVVIDLMTKSCCPPLWPSMHPTNPGVLFVRHYALRKWLMKGGAFRYS